MFNDAESDCEMFLCKNTLIIPSDLQSYISIPNNYYRLTSADQKIQL